MRPFFCRGLALAIALAVSTPCVAFAQEEDTYASLEASPEELVEKAKALAREKKWKEALPFFQRAYQSQTSYDVVGNLGITEHELGMYVEAATHLSEALRGFPIGGPPIKKQALEERLAEVKAQVVELEIALDPSSACLELDEKEVGCGPFNSSLFAAPDQPITLRATAPGHRVGTEERTASAGEKISIQLSLASYEVADSASATPAPTTEGGDTTALVPEWPSYVVAGTGLAIMIAGGALFAVAEGIDGDTQSEVDDLRATTGLSSPCSAPSPAVADRCATLADDLAQHDTLSNAGMGLLWGGFGVFAVGGLLYGLTYVDDGGGEGAPEEAAWVDPIVSWDQVGLRLRGRW